MSVGTLRVGVLGGGIAGLSAGIALRLAGHEVQVFERREGEGGLGAGIVCWPNAAFVLRELLFPNGSPNPRCPLAKP